MYVLKSNTKNELRKVQAAIKKELSSEKIIQDIYKYIFNAEGKKTRALISLLASKSSNIKSSIRIDLASIIELLHTATLVHDDVVDESDLRRGTKSVNQVWTNSYSVLMGDFIYSFIQIKTYFFYTSFISGTLLVNNIFYNFTHFRWNFMFSIYQNS